MNINKCQCAILIIFSLFMSIFSPLIGGQDDDADGGGGIEICSFGGGFSLIPVFFPDFDAHRGRALIQLPGAAPALPVQKCVKKTAMPKEEPVVDKTEPSFPKSKSGSRVSDNDKREVIALDHGSADNPFMVCDHGLVYAGALLGAAIVDPHTGGQANILSKWQITRSNWAYRLADNYDDAKNMRWGKSPKKIKDFDNWKIGDWMRKNGILGLTIYGGGGWFTADARAGATLRGIWSRHIQKIGDSLIRVSFTREQESGPLMRAQGTPLQKSEKKFVTNRENTMVFLFDLMKEEEGEALEALLDKRMLRAKDFAETLVDDDKATLLTTRNVKRKKVTTTPFQAGLPLLIRFRISHHVDKPFTSIVNNRNGEETQIVSKAHLRQKTYRHINLPRRNDGKKWKYFTFTNFHFNQSFGGSVVTKSTSQQRHLHAQISFTHDNAKVKTLNKYADLISRKVGVNNFVLDAEYDEDARIGFVEMLYKLKVGPSALSQLVMVNSDKAGIFTNTANELIDDYFYRQDDPHDICEHSLQALRERCINKQRKETISALNKIEKNLLGLYRVEVKDESEAEAAHYLAKISKALSTNQFVLQAFILQLPEREKGYGKLEIFGEKFMAKRFKVDPNKQHDLADNDNDGSDEEDYVVVDWDRINAGEEENYY